MKAKDVKVGDHIQVPWSDKPLKLNCVAVDWLGRIVLKGELLYLGIWDAHDEVPIITDCPACKANIPRRDAK